ncbi:hypothetical protein D915_009890, partial [Fasciola hepatica]
REYVVQAKQNEVHHFLGGVTVRAALTASRFRATARGRRIQYYCFFRWHFNALSSHGFLHILGDVSWIDPVVDIFNCRGYRAYLAQVFIVCYLLTNKWIVASGANGFF